MAERRPQNIDPKVWEEALRKARDLKDEMKEVDVVLDSISQRVIGMGLDAWFDTVRKTAEQIRVDQEQLDEVSGRLLTKQSEYNDILKRTSDQLNQQANLGSLINDTMTDSEIITQLTNAGYGQLIGKASSVADIKQFINELDNDNLDLTRDINRELAETLISNSNLAGNLTQVRGELTGIAEEYAVAEANAQKLEDRAFSFWKGAGEYSKVFAKQTVDMIFEFDQAINEFQQSSGVIFDGMNMSVADLMSNTRGYGMSVSETTELMQGLGDSLRTVNGMGLKEAVEDFAPLQRAIGVTSSEITDIAGEMMRWGKSSADVREYFEDIHKDAQGLGVNTRNVVHQITQNIGKMRQFGFTEGEESLKRMATRAELLRVSMDEIFDVAQKARTLEGALDMAAELQLAGGSFSQINPMDLLAAARKGPEELGKILTSMGSDIGRFNKETGKYEFDPIDADRLQIVSQATGLSLDFIQNSIMKTDEMARKADIFGNAFAGLSGVDKELADSQFAQMLITNDKGQIEISDKFAKVFKQYGVDNDNLKNLRGEVARDILKAANKERDNLEERNSINQGLEASFKNMIGALQSTAAVLQPVFDGIAWAANNIAQAIGDMPDWGKQITGWGIAATFFANKMMKIFKGKSMIQSIRDGMRSGASNTPNAPTTGGGGRGGVGSSIGSGITGLARGVKVASRHAAKIKMGGMVKLAGSLALLSAPIIGFGYAVSKIGGEASMKQLATAAASLVLLGGGVAAFSSIPVNVGNVAKGALAMGILGAALIPVSYAFGLLNDLNLGQVLGALGIITLATLGIIGLGALLVGPQILAVLVGVGTLIAIGAGLAVAGAGLMVAGMAFEQLTNINWDGLTKMAGALFVATPALISFGLGALAFANPLTILGIVSMTGTLAMLAAVMIPLASSLTVGADGMERFANSINNLKSAVREIDVSKLEEIQETAASMASASRSSSLDKLASTIQGFFGGGDSENSRDSERKIVVEIQMDGKKLQSKILKDTRVMVGR